MDKADITNICKYKNFTYTESFFFGQYTVTLSHELGSVTETHADLNTAQMRAFKNLVNLLSTKGL